MICVSVGERDYRTAIAVASRYSFAEIRLDIIRNIDFGKVDEIFSSHNNLIATCRETGQNKEFRLRLVERALRGGAAWADMDIDENPKDIAAVRDICLGSASENGERRQSLIISYHNYDETPGMEILDKIVEALFDMGADVAKIACAANCPAEVERLLSLPDCYRGRKIVVAGMGTLGGRVRILSGPAGSFFTYAFPGGAKPTAEGQLDYETLLGNQERLKHEMLS